MKIKLRVIKINLFVNYLFHYFWRVTGVWSYHQGSPFVSSLNHHVLQLFTPDVFTSIVDVKTIRDHCHKSIGELLQHVGEGITLALLPPRCDRAAY